VDSGGTGGAGAARNVSSRRTGVTKLQPRSGTVMTLRLPPSPSKDAAQGAHLNLQVRFFDECLRPGFGDQLLFADHLAGAFDQRGQNVKSAAAHPHRLVALEQEPLRCKEPVRAKRDRVFVHGQVAGVTRRAGS